MQLSPDNDANPARELSDRPKFNVVIIYEDRGTGRRAKYFYENLVHELKGECDFNLELWNFQVLAISEIGNSAARVAAQADFVNTALIALVDKPKTSDGTAAFTVAYLRSVANRAGIDFFIHTFFCRSTN